jgi:CheY-like chemotaxis protein
MPLDRHRPSAGAVARPMAVSLPVPDRRCVAGRGCPSCRSGARSQDGHDGGVSLILILSDINMPGMSGLELLPKAKALRPDVPVIMITAYGDADTKRKALESGAEALLTKPIDFVTLRAEIDLLVERAA